MAHDGRLSTLIACRLGVTEGAVCYRLKRKELGLSDGRKVKPPLLDAYQGVIAAWLDHYLDKRDRAFIH